MLKDVLTRCNLPLSLCRGQAFDGAATIQGKRKGQATLIRSEVPAAIPVHYVQTQVFCAEDQMESPQTHRRELLLLFWYIPWVLVIAD